MNEQLTATGPSQRPGWKARLRRAALPFYKPSRSALLPSPWRYALMRPAIFELWFRARAFRFMATRGLRNVEGEQTSFMSGVRDYNQSQMWEFYRMRTEKFMPILRCIDAVPANPRILVIGPRNEAELLLLSLYGFPLRNIVAVDLFSYSPHVKCMDMHDLAFPDNSFDIVYSAWTLKYSYDLPKACAELVRVAKPGGLVVTGFSHTHVVTAEVGASLQGGLSELLATFGPSVGWVYWQESTPIDNGAAEEVSVIFQVRKDAEPRP